MSFTIHPLLLASSVLCLLNPPSWAAEPPASSTSVAKPRTDAIAEVTPEPTPPVVLVSPLVPGEELSAEEVRVLRIDAETIQRAAASHDWATVTAKTYPGLITLAGGPEKFAEVTRHIAEEIQNNHIKVLETSLGAPSPLYEAGSEQLCFLPKAFLIEVDGQRVRSVSYLVAVRSSGKAGWRYLDGGGMQDDPQMLWRLFPQLPRTLALPPNTAEPAP